MKRAVALLLIFAGIWAVAFADEYFIICNPKGTVNARIRANTKAEVVGLYLCGDSVQTDGKTRNGFAHIVNVSLEVDNAWISARYLVPDKPVTGEWEAVIIGTGRVAARRCIGGERLKWVKPGSIVTVYAISEDWCVTNCGYIQTKYLEVHDNGT